MEEGNEDQGERQGKANGNDEVGEGEWRKESLEELVEDRKSQRLHGCFVKDIVEELAQQQEEMKYQPRWSTSQPHNSSFGRAMPALCPRSARSNLQYSPKRTLRASKLDHNIQIFYREIYR